MKKEAVLKALIVSSSLASIFLLLLKLFGKYALLVTLYFFVGASILIAISIVRRIEREESHCRKIPCKVVLSTGHEVKGIATHLSTAKIELVDAVERVKGRKKYKKRVVIPLSIVKRIEL